MNKFQKALITIEKIASINNEDEKNPVLNDIYKIAHAYTGSCKNPHDDWKKEGEELSEKLKDY